MKTFLNQYNFADEQSKTNALLALEPPRPSAFLVLSDGPGTGKTTLVTECLNRIFGLDYPVESHEPKTDRRRDMVLLEACERGYLWIDDVRRIKRVSAQLMSFLTSEHFQCRRFRSTEIAKVEGKCVTFITGNFSVVPTDLERRVHIIRLARRSEWAF